MQHAEFQRLLDEIAGRDQSARLRTIDRYDHQRKHYGKTAAENWLVDQPQPAYLKQLSRAVKDPVALNRLDFIIKNGDKATVSQLSHHFKIADIGQQIMTFGGLTEAKIRDLAKFAAPYDAKLERRKRREYRRKSKQATALLNLHLGLVGGEYGYKHCTPHEIQLRNQQKSGWRTMGENTILEKDEEQIPLIDIMKGAHSGKAAEIYAMTKGLEEVAKEQGLDWAFVTITCPPRMHPNPSKGKKSWDGTTPDQAHAWINKVWKKIRARLSKRGIRICGLRVAEPHADGCPHWHMLIFAYPNDLAEIEATFREEPHFMSEEGFKFAQNNGGASAATYCWKYVMKTISNIEKLEGEQASVDAWRSTWSIRAFQFFGLPQLSVWRALRELKLRPDHAPHLAQLWDAAHEGNGYDYIKGMGGLCIKKTERTFVVKTQPNDESGKYKTTTFIQQMTGEIFIFSKKKWQKKAAKSDKNMTLGQLLTRVVTVIPNYPSKNQTPKSQPQTPKTEHPNLSPSPGRQGGGVKKPTPPPLQKLTDLPPPSSSSLGDRGTARLRLRGGRTIASAST